VLVFTGRDGKIAFLHEHMVPHSEQSVGPSKPMLAVVELQDGTIGRLGLKVGDQLRHAVFGNPPAP
ncbi:MAG: DUF192 domain-containing protein, partial [Alphaproteobacteria bacterium]|nr:DUF192 domain-containing protein [Alphaproteobacteria bacterium]